LDRDGRRLGALLPLVEERKGEEADDRDGDGAVKNEIRA
jgi:hypothetical protein